jgi:bifunctional non-homologous end joining protein LigD
MAKQVREGKVFIDWSQNSAHKSTVCVYSLRAKKETPFASMPMTWDEIERAIKTKKGEEFLFDPDAAIARVEKLGDLFAPVLKLKQKLPKTVMAKLKSAGTIEEKEPRKKTSGPARKGTDMAAYRAKRDFTKTAEPPPAVKKASSKERMFVIQKHDASHLHYDFRLELDGVLKSWAVPKGPPYERGQKRLAMQVEDHPMSYARFEGTIPQGQYGGGTVMVWDIGTYAITDGSFNSGKLHMVLKGKKLKGEWILVKSHMKDRNGEERSWFLIKGGADMKPLSAKRDDSSALTGRSMARIESQNDAQWDSNR